MLAGGNNTLEVLTVQMSDAYLHTALELCRQHDHSHFLNEGDNMAILSIKLFDNLLQSMADTCP